MSSRGSLERKKRADNVPSPAAGTPESSLVKSPEDAAPASHGSAALEQPDAALIDAPRGHRFAKLPILSHDRAASRSSEIESFDDQPLQAKLTVSQPGDPLEDEADAVAEQVVASNNGDQIARRRSVGRASGAQAKSAADDPGVSDATSDRVQSVVEGGKGEPLDERTRAYMEPRFGHSFAAVRVHTDPNAADSAAAVQARAYTLGSNIVFAPGQFAPATESGQRLLAHELTHVVQQTSGSAGSDDATGQRAIQREPNSTPAPPPAPSSSPAGPAPAMQPNPPAPAAGAPPGMGGATTPSQAVTAQFVKVTVSTGADPEYSSNSRNTGSGTVVLSANPEETFASLRALGAADMWNMACVVGNLSNWAATAPDPAPDQSPGGSGSVQIANANPADTAYDANYRAAFPHFKKHVQTFYKKFKDFQQEFKENGTKATLGLVKESRARTEKTLQDLGITTETTTERGPVGMEPNTSYKSDSAKNKALSEAATELAKKQEAVEKLLKKREDLRGIVHWATTSEETIVKEEEAIDKEITEARMTWQDEKRKARSTYPILSYFESTEQLKMLSNPAATAHHVGSKLHEVLDNTKELEEKLNAGNDRILTLPEHLNRLADALNLNPFERRTVSYMREKYTGDIETGQRVGMLIAIVLAAIAAAPTAGGSLVALAAVGEAAINTTMLLQAYDQYSFEKAATGSSEEKADALSHDEPSLFWLAFQFVSTMVGLGGNAKVVMTELKAGFNEIKTAYKGAAMTGQTAQLEGVLAAKKISKDASAGIVARALKESVAILEGIAKGGPEGLQAALDLLKTSPSFYGVRMAVWRIKAGGNVDVARQNLQLARQQVVNKIVEEQKARFPKATFVTVDQGFEKPIIVKIGSSEPLPAPASSGPPSSPPSSGTPSSGPPSSAPPTSAGSAATAKGPDALPPEALKTPAKPLPSGILVQAKKTSDAAADAAAASGSAGTAAAGGSAAGAADSAASPMGAPSAPGVVAPMAKSVDAPAGGFHPPMAIPEGANQAMSASEALQSLPQAQLGGGNAVIGIDMSVQMEPTVAPYGPMNPRMQKFYGDFPGIPKPEYNGIYLNVSTRFKVEEDMTRKFGKMGTSGKVILTESAGGSQQLYMFKAGGGEHPGVAQAHELRPGTFFISGRASYDIAMDLPTVGKDIVPLGVVVYNGQVGSLQPFIKNTESLGDLMEGKALNPAISKANAEALFHEIWDNNAQFKTFRENLRAYDHVINNPDRNIWNYLVEFNDDMTVKRFYAIDQDLALKPGARSVMVQDREAIPRFAPKNVLNPIDEIRNPNTQRHLDKISKTLYDEFVMMKVNEASVREALAGTYGLDKPTLDGIFQRLDEVLGDYNLRLQTMKPEEVFAP